MSIRARTSRRDPHRFDAGAGQGRVGGFGELPGPVADQEPECRGPLTQVQQEIADLLGGPRPVRVRGYPEDVHVAGADLGDEQAVQAPERYRAVHRICVTWESSQVRTTCGRQGLPRSDST